MLDEASGRLILKEAFEAQGYTITENYPMTVDRSTVELDGYDPEARLGYEYSSAEDGLDFGLLEGLMAQNQCRLFVIDEEPGLDAQEILNAVFEFFREMDGQ
jgi:hypothetical protein